MRRKVYQLIASRLQAYRSCLADVGKADWAVKHREALQAMARDLLPSGSGVDSGTRIDLDASRPERIVLAFSYHHMNDLGSYDGWSDHTVVVTPSLVSDFDLRITGRDRNDAKDYLGDLFGDVLSLWAEERFDVATERYSYVGHTDRG